MNLIDCGSLDFSNLFDVIRRIGARNHRFQFGYVILANLAVGGVRIRRQFANARFYFRPRTLHEPFQHLSAGHNESDLSAHLSHHGAESDAVCEGAFFNRRAGKLDGEKIHSACAQVSNEKRQKIPHADAGGKLTRNFDLHRLRHAKPVRSIEPRSGDIRIADACGKRTDGTQKIHVAVRSEDDVPRFDLSVFKQYVLPDAPVNIVDVFDPLFLGELTDDFLIGRYLLRVGGGLKVEGESDLVRIPNLSLVLRYLLKLQDAVGPSKISGGGPVDIAPDAVSQLNRFPRGPFHNLHDHCLTHLCDSPL